MKCEYCDNVVPNTATKCPSCGAAVMQQAASEPTGFPAPGTQSVFTPEESFKAKVVHLKPYYQDEFTKMFNSNGAYNGKWNWAAFCFSWIWAMSKGLVVQGIIMLVVSIVLAALSDGVASIAVPIYFGFRGNKLYYEKFVNQKDVYV